MNIQTLKSINDIPASEWDSLNIDDNPFTCHAFLWAAEKHGATIANLGWYPCHVLLRDQNGTLLGALPLFLRTHSFGDFSHDWQWASAYDRLGLHYYPKLVSANPYTPTSGTRFLVAAQADRETVVKTLLKAVLHQVPALQASCWQCLYLRDYDLALLKQEGLLIRQGTQFHWHNRGYRHFDDFLATFSADKRKKAKRERRRIAEQGLTISVRHGDEVESALWDSIHTHYRETFLRYGNHPAFSRDFFVEIGAALQQRLVFFLALDGDKHIATAICYRDRETLYGRHWGADAEYHSLHFELCFYQGIDYCIANGLQRFEPGAQGEHKLSRGFEPADTWSAFWIAEERMRPPIADFLQRERQAVANYQDEMAEHTPFKN
jgi:hypothetical protein